jgi:Protein of unknown function (DUF3152)
MRAVLAFVACLLLAGCATAAHPVPVADPSSPSPPGASAPREPGMHRDEPPAKRAGAPGPPRPGGGSGVFGSTASGASAVFGGAGTLKRYCVQVEDGITTFTADDFAAGVDQVLADRRSWIASKRWMFQRVPDCATVGVRVRLTTPPSVDRFCASAGVQTLGKYSCFNAGSLYINLNRWTSGVPHYPSLELYRHLVINHEMGHYLGFQHVSCPGPGRPAPVMQRQSASLDGCVANPYPYPDGVAYVG